MTSRAAFQTSASTQPPPTVPMNEPSSRTRILALSKLGIEPFTWTMVATAHFWPSFRSRTISSYRSIRIDYIVDLPTEDEIRLRAQKLVRLDPSLLENRSERPLRRVSGMVR